MMSDEGSIKLLSKRGAPLSVIGGVAKLLFGTLTEEDGLKIQKRYNELLSSEQKIANLGKEQAHLVKKELGRTAERMGKL